MDTFSVLKTGMDALKVSGDKLSLTLLFFIGIFIAYAPVTGRIKIVKGGVI